MIIRHGSVFYPPPIANGDKIGVVCPSAVLPCVTKLIFGGGYQFNDFACLFLKEACFMENMVNIICINCWRHIFSSVTPSHWDVKRKTTLPMTKIRLTRHSHLPLALSPKCPGALHRRKGGWKRLWILQTGTTFKWL